MKLTFLGEQGKLMRHDPVFSWSWKISLIVFVITVGLLMFLWRELPPKLPLFYSLPWGEEQLSSPPGLLILCLSSLLVFAINNLIALVIRPISVFLSHLLVVCGAVISFLTSVSIVQILLLIS